MIRPRCQKTCLQGFVNHKISIFYLVSVAEKTKLESHFVGNHEDRFYHIKASCLWDLQ